MSFHVSEGRATSRNYQVPFFELFLWDPDQIEELKQALAAEVYHGSIREETEDDEKHGLSTHQRKPSRKPMTGCYDMFIAQLNRARCTSDQKSSMTPGLYEIESRIMII